MIKQSTKIRVRYSETDRMGFVYYGNYAQYIEVGRVEALRKVGISYKELEDSGYLLPVRDFNIKYLKAALYDDELTIETTIESMPDNRIHFSYEVKRDTELLVTASTTLFFINEKGRACKPPNYFIELMAPYFS